MRPNPTVRSRGRTALAVTFAGVVVALLGAQAADAAFALPSSVVRGGGDRSAQHCNGGGFGPCFFLSVALSGSGSVTSIIPVAVPGAATPQEQYPYGHLTCPETADWTCKFYFNWPIAPEDPNNSTVVLQATPAPGEVFLGWEECPHPQGADGLQCKVLLEDLGGIEGSCVHAYFSPGDPVVSLCEDAIPPPPPPIEQPVDPIPPPPPPPPAAPNAVVLKKPPKHTRSRSAIFYWAGKRSGAYISGFKSQCKLDKQRVWKSCRSGKFIQRLKPGTHTFRVRIYAAGRWDPTPAVYVWHVKK